MEKFEYVTISFIALITMVLGFIFSGEPNLSNFLLDNSVDSLYFAFIMWWETWWALVLGFSIAGAVEAWISGENISQKLEGHGVKELSLAAFFGFISSSCSYSAIATAKNLFKKGASAAASLASFMFASTNLVIEIGLVMLILLGWEFVLANFIGGILLIIIMALTLTYLVPDRIIEEARSYANQESEDDEDINCASCGMDVSEKDISIEKDGEDHYFCSDGCKHDYETEMEKRSVKTNMTSKRGWIQLAKTQFKEWSMLWEDILVGFILAGIIASFIPESVWLSLFDEGIFGLPVYVLWTAALGVVIGVVTFVCSVGNVPFAAVLWSNGLPFGSVLSFIYADLIVPPIMHAYKKYYGFGFAVILSGLIFGSAVIAGYVIHFIFLGASLIPPTSTAVIVDRTIEFNYKAVLNGLFSIVFVVFLWLKNQDQ